MRIKNFTLLLLLGIFGLLTVNAQAQQDSTIDPSQIRYWVGEGESQAILAVNWADPDTCLAWGYRFDGNITVKEMMVAIADADHRFSFDAPSSFVNDIMYNDGFLDLSITEYGYMMFNVNGEMSMDYYDTKVVVDGDFVKWGDTNCGTMIDPENWVYVWEAPVVPVYPLAEDAMIEASEIAYWVGEGEKEAILAVNWAAPDTCLAWGFRFDAETLTVKDMMDAIAEADGRFAYVASDGFLTDITFTTGTLQMGLVGMYWMYNVNGGMALNGFGEQVIADGDFVKLGDESCGTEIAQWTLVWETPVTPVSNPASIAEQSLAVMLYPNPASSYTMLSVSEMKDQVTVTVNDLQGRVLDRFAVGQSAEPIRIETRDYVPGLYFVTITDGMSRQTTKLTIQ